MGWGVHAQLLASRIDSLVSMHRGVLEEAALVHRRDGRLGQVARARSRDCVPGGIRGPGCAYNTAHTLDASCSRTTMSTIGAGYALCGVDISMP